MRYLSLATALLVLINVEGRLRVVNQDENTQQEQETPRVTIVVRSLQEQELGELKGLGGNPGSQHMPLQLCEGDCDEDDDCDVGLRCFQRDKRMAVPGCIGGEEENSKTDFCVPDLAQTQPPQAVETLNPTTAAPDPVPPTAAAATAAPVPAPVPTTPKPTTVSPTPLPIAPTRAPTSPPTETLLWEIEKVGNNGSPRDVFPLGRCQGDCDDDDECMEGLICFHRDAGDSIPGCLGEDRSRNDYCIPDPEAVPTASPSLSQAPSDPPTTQLPTSAPSVVTILPTSSNRPSLRPSVSMTPTSVPSDYPSNVPTDRPSDMPSESASPTSSAVPTATPSGSPTVEPLEGIRIKLYWEEGYTWQDETVERKWCMVNNYNGYPGTGKCWHGLHTEPCHDDMVYVARCETDKRQQFTILPMPGGTQYQISMFREKLCLERFEYSLVLRECNYMNPLQRFWIPRGAVFQKRFELSPITLANHCVTQAHHPKSGEVVELHPCSRARHEEHQSSFWEVN